MALGSGATLGGFVPFGPDSAWNQDISAAPVDPNSSSIISYIGSSATLHPDFGSDPSQGLPYAVVDSSQLMVMVNGNASSGESDPSAMPIPAGAPIEAGSDHHVLVLQRGTCWLYELYNASVDASGHWTADFGTVWDLLGNEQRPYTWSSSDAAGLSIFAGLVRYAEVASGAINHAIRFTVPSTKAAFVTPATHWAATNSGSPIPMGMRLRLKASFDVSGFSPTNQVILKAMKKYGMIMADNGSAMYITGAPDSHWNNDDLRLLGQVTASNFEVLRMPTQITLSNVPSGPAPSISNFSASAGTVSAGTPVTLSWNVTGASYLFISPKVGPVRGSSVTFTPNASGSYTLYATNQYGRTTATTAVNVTSAPAGAISGRVSDISSGYGISGAVVRFSGGSTSTDGSGNYRLSGLAVGSYTVTASASGYFSESAAATVTSGSTSTANIQLPTGGILAGTVTGSNGAVLANATVTVSGGKVSTTGTRITNSAGAYNTSWVPVGAYNVTVSASGYATQYKTATVNTGATTTLNVSMSGGSTSSTSAIAGRVTNISTGGSVAGATVSFGSRSTTANSTGNYSATNVAQGTYSVTAEANGYFTRTQSVTTTAGATSTLNFQLATGGKVQGTAKNSSGAVISGASVTISGGSIATTVNTSTNSSGYYNSNWIPVGTYVVIVRVPASTQKQSKTVNVTAGSTATLNFNF